MLHENRHLNHQSAKQFWDKNNPWYEANAWDAAFLGSITYGVSIAVQQSSDGLSRYKLYMDIRNGWVERYEKGSGAHYYYHPSLTKDPSPPPPKPWPDIGF
jgi:hypothetical protein